MTAVTMEITGASSRMISEQNYLHDFTINGLTSQQPGRRLMRSLL